MALWGGPCGRELRPPHNSPQPVGGSCPQADHKHSDVCRLGQHLDCSLMKNPEPEPPSKCAPKFLPQKPCKIINNYCCFKLRCFEVACYAAMDNEYPLDHRLFNHQPCFIHCGRWSPAPPQCLTQIKCSINADLNNSN